MGDTTACTLMQPGVCVQTLREGFYLPAGLAVGIVKLQQQDLNASAALLIQLYAHLQGMMQPASWAGGGSGLPQRQR